MALVADKPETGLRLPTLRHSEDRKLLEILFKHYEISECVVFLNQSQKWVVIVCM